LGSKHRDSITLPNPSIIETASSDNSYPEFICYDVAKDIGGIALSSASGGQQQQLPAITDDTFRKPTPSPTCNFKPSTTHQVHSTKAISNIANAIDQLTSTVATLSVTFSSSPRVSARLLNILSMDNPRTHLLKALEEGSITLRLSMNKETSLYYNTSGDGWCWLRILLQLENRAVNCQSVNDVDLTDELILSRLSKNLELSSSSTKSIIEPYLKILRQGYKPLPSKDYQPLQVHDGYLPNLCRSAFMGYSSDNKVCLATSSLFPKRYLDFTLSELREILGKSFNRYAIVGNHYFLLPMGHVKDIELLDKGVDNLVQQFVLLAHYKLEVTTINSSQNPSDDDPQVDYGPVAGESNNSQLPYLEENGINYQPSDTSSQILESAKSETSSLSSENSDLLPNISKNKVSVKLKITQLENQILNSLTIWQSKGFKLRGFNAALGRYIGVESTNLSQALKSLKGVKKIQDSFGPSNILTASPSDAQLVFTQGFADSAIRTQDPLTPLNTPLSQVVQAESDAVTDSNGLLTPSIVFKQKPIRHIAKNKRAIWIQQLSSTLSNVVKSFEKPVEDEISATLELFNLPFVFSKVRASVKKQTRSTTRPYSKETHISFALKQASTNVKCGQLTKAVRILESASNQSRPVELTDEVKYNLAKLHPVDSYVEDTLPDVSDIIITQEVFQECLRGLSKHSANGFSSWTFELIQLSCQEPSIFSLFHDLINIIAAGRIRARYLWLRSRLIAIQKPNKKIRPIAIGESLIRLASRCISKSYINIATSPLAPYQYGVGVKNGAEIIIHSLNLTAKEIAAGKDMSITSVDCENAFNSISRRAIKDGIEQHCPSLLPFFLWSYGTAVDLLSDNGEIVCQSTTGVRQGDPLGPLFFCLGVSAILKETASANPSVTIMAYMDDIYITGNQVDSIATFNFIQHSLANIGLKVNIDKCVQYSPVVNTQIPTNSEGICVLGSYIGKDHFIKNSVESSLAQASNILGLISKLNAPEAFLLTRQCINMRPFYLARVTPPTLFEEGGKNFDSKISLTLQSITKLEFDDIQERIRHLPCRLGGLGVSSIAIISPSAWEASYHHSIVFIKDRYPWLLDILQPSQCEESTDNLQSQKQLMDVKNKQLFSELQDLIDNPRDSALFLSHANPGTSQWMFSSLSSNPIDPADYVEALRLRLLTPTFSYCKPRRGTSCPACHRSDIAADHYHALICRTFSYFTKWRHDRIRDCLVTFIKSVVPSAIVSKEQSLTALMNNETENNLICDVFINHSTHYQIIDVCVANPTSQSSLSAGSARNPLSAALCKERSKQHLYRKHLNSTAFSKFVPFVLESTGALGTATKKFLDDVCGFGSLTTDPATIKEKRVQLVRSISSILVRANAQLVRHGRSAGLALSLS
jgi:hypothetical protein